MTTNWIEEFDKQFTPKGGEGISFIDSGLYEYTKDIKHFITTLLEKQREEYVEMIEKYFKDTWYEDLSSEELITLIKSHDKTSYTTDTSEQNISFLRQWLNEDRIDDPRKMITNDDIKHWLKINDIIK